MQWLELTENGYEQKQTHRRSSLFLEVIPAPDVDQNLTDIMVGKNHPISTAGSFSHHKDV